MSPEQSEIRVLSSHLLSLRPPAHVMLIHGSPQELDALRQELRALEYSDLTIPCKDLHSPRTQSEAAVGLDHWMLRNVGDCEPSNPEKLIRDERRMRDRRPPIRVACAYPCGRFIGMGEEACVNIFTAHDSVLFTRFSKGGSMLQESAEKALLSALGCQGAEILYSYIEQRGIERHEIPLRFMEYSGLLRELMGTGADSLSQLAYQALFQKIMSSMETIVNES